MLNARDIDDNDAKAANCYSSKIEVENEERKRREGRKDEKSFHQREGKRGGKKIESTNFLVAWTRGVDIATAYRKKMAIERNFRRVY